MKRGKILALLTTGHAAEHWYLGVLVPVLPFLVKDLGITLTQVGFFLAGRSVCGAISSAGTGYVTDKIGGGKWVLVVCLLGIAFFYTWMGLTTGALVLFPVFWLSGLASHLWHPPSMGYISERFSDRKGFALGIHGTGANIGQTLAPLAAGFLLLTFTWRDVLLLNMVPVVLAAILIAVFLPAFRAAPGSSPKKPQIHFRQATKELLANPLLTAALFLSGSINIAHNGINTFLPILLLNKYGAGPEWVGLSLGVYAAAAIAPEAFVGYISDKISRKFVLILGLSVGGVSLMFIPAMAPGPLMLIPLLSVGIFLRSLRPVIFAHALDVAPDHLKGSTIGMIFTSNQVFSGLGPIAAGLIADSYGIETAIWFFGGFSLLMIPMFAILPKFPDKVNFRTSAEGKSDSAPLTP